MEEESNIEKKIIIENNRNLWEIRQIERKGRRGEREKYGNRERIQWNRDKLKVGDDKNKWRNKKHLFEDVAEIDRKRCL